MAGVVGHKSRAAPTDRNRGDRIVELIEVHRIGTADPRSHVDQSALAASYPERGVVGGAAIAAQRPERQRSSPGRLRAGTDRNRVTAVCSRDCPTVETGAEDAGRRADGNVALRSASYVSCRCLGAKSNAAAAGG